MRVIVGLSGATGAVYGIRLLEELKKQGAETHLVISKWGEHTIAEETVYTAEIVKSLAAFNYDVNDLSCSISSGSFPVDAMVISPCSMKTLAGIACGITDNLLVRAADVCLKERRKLILLARESPLSLIHLENMVRVTKAGAIVMPPVPAFYTKPQSLDDLINQTVWKIIDQLGLPAPMYKRWKKD